MLRIRADVRMYQPRLYSLFRSRACPVDDDNFSNLVSNLRHEAWAEPTVVLANVAVATLVSAPLIVPLVKLSNSILSLIDTVNWKVVKAVR